MATVPSDQPKRSNRAYRSPSAWLVLLGVLCLGLGFDLWTKQWSFQTIAHESVTLDRSTILADPDHNPIPHHPGRVALPWGLLDFRLVVNRGAVFGIGANQRWFFVAFTVAALAAGLIVFGRFTRGPQHMAHVALALILAGGLGNLFDRIAFGVVRDFLHMLPDRNLPFGWTWPGGNPELFPWVFNIADVMLLSGMVILMIYINRNEKHRQHAAAQAREAAPGAAMNTSPADEAA